MQRVLGVAVVALAALVVIQALALRRNRGELAQARAWAAAADLDTRRDEILRSGQWLHTWLQSPDGGSRVQGRCVRALEQEPCAHGRDDDPGARLRIDLERKRGHGHCQHRGRGEQPREPLPLQGGAQQPEHGDAPHRPQHQQQQVGHREPGREDTLIPG